VGGAEEEQEEVAAEELDACASVCQKMLKQI
jgi:hypothetical protein